MDDKNKRTFGIIGVAVTSLLCGCPGCFVLLRGVESFGETLTAGSDVPGSIAGVMLLCTGLFMTAIPTVIGFYAFRRKKTRFDPNEPLPPAI